MEREIYNLIKDFDSIVIARHKNPDLDAYGSQFGLYYALKARFPEKKIYAIGDTNSLNFFQEMDKVDDDIKKESLVFVLDTVAKQMLNEEDYIHNKKIVFIDHHRNMIDVDSDYYIRDTESSSTAEMVTNLLIQLGFEITKDSARALYMGIIGDTGRFMYNSTTANTLRTAAVLLDKGINIQEIHDLIYLESIENKQIKNIFFNSVKITKENVAYRKNKKEFIEKYNLDTNFVSRGLVGQMSGIKEIPIWANFTYDSASERIFCELRSRNKPVLDIAKKYGGGGHLYACGCSVETWEEVDKIIKDLNKLAKER
ncbi:MAG: bifunctional oligoribonuclease/PAP phosphatase NrnA [Candidatus Izemoplasmatales bacterium]|nr:bifunctional oligoribonuclease/PAP phosphatase NrnA [Candidatus Izemoplasmatales bacterium]MDD4069921.1 bifunctional oligoribonuclease/PAP phosphatase NrnA [Candidatus Izemoplasmatales bacterium]